MGTNSVEHPLCVQQTRGLWPFCGDHGEGPQPRRELLPPLPAAVWVGASTLVCVAPEEENAGS